MVEARSLRWYRQPILHFALVGAVLFALDHVRQPAPAAPQTDAAIELSATQRRELAAQLAARHGREPSPDELAKAREHWIEEEVLYREGLQLGLDREDTLIRAHIIEKMRFTIGHTITTPEPSEAELRELYQRHTASYQLSTRYDFEHLELSDGEAPNLELARSYRGRTRENMRAVLGSALSEPLLAAPRSEWLTLSVAERRHMLRLSAVHEPELPSFDQLKGQLAADWKLEKQRDATLEKLKALRRAYHLREDDA